jgi:hypothetical protein
MFQLHFYDCITALRGQARLTDRGAARLQFGIAVMFGVGIRESSLGGGPAIG